MAVSGGQAGTGPIALAQTVSRDHAFHQLRVLRVVQETVDARSFVFAVPPDSRGTFAYEAGQFITFRVRIGDETHHRCYSMSSAAEVDADLQVTVKRVPGGLVSNWMLDTLAPGSVVEASRPSGTFCLEPNDRDLVAFAAGSGITPVFSLVKAALATTSRRIRLFYANRDQDAVIFAGALAELAELHPSRIDVAHHLDVEKGFVNTGAVCSFLDGVTDADHYICGPAPFMDIVENGLLSTGVTEDRIHLERFTPASGPAPSPPTEPTELTGPPEPPDDDRGGTRVTIDLGGRRDTADHHPGATVLQTARQMDMAPPFSCESGNCATCMAKVVEGAVTMHINNALTDDEVTDGWVLTCQAVPSSGSVHVVYPEV